MCTTKLCTTDSEYCGESSSDFTKRDAGIPESQELSVTINTQSLEKRVAEQSSKILVGKIKIVIIIAAYPSIGSIWKVSQAALVLKKAFWMRSGYCGGSTLDVKDLPNSPSQEQYRGLNVEHPMDKRLIG